MPADSPTSCHQASQENSLNAPIYPDGFRPPDAVADTSDFDVLIVGGGINGVGIARDLAGRGLKVALCEQDDLASHTSSASTKLIHGGLRYLEHGDVLLVRKALAEREVLLRSAPHIMQALRFVLPHDAQGQHMRPAWMIRLGLFLYDHLARRTILPASHGIDLRSAAAGAALQTRLTQGYVYSDGWVDDARLVVLGAIDARERGALIMTRTRCVSAQRTDTVWAATLRERSGLHRRVRAKVLVNAAGPWAESFLRQDISGPATQALCQAHLRLVRGSHIVIKRPLSERHPSDHAFIFQNPDGRIIFAIPYEEHFTLIGTTDLELPLAEAPTAQAEQCSDEEVAYLCEQANRYLRAPIKPTDVVWRFAGVRPLLNDDSGNPSAVTRDYQLDTDSSAAPILTVWGGKITTFRRLAEEASNKIEKMLGQRARPWTRSAPLPGGDLSAWITASGQPGRDFDRFVAALTQRHPGLPPALLLRWARAYGSRVSRLLGTASCVADLGAEIAPGLFEAELRHLVADEWAQDADDVLWRRSKLGLHFTAEQSAAVKEWLRAQDPSRQSPRWSPSRAQHMQEPWWAQAGVIAPDVAKPRAAAVATVATASPIEPDTNQAAS